MNYLTFIYKFSHLTNTGSRICIKLNKIIKNTKFLSYKFKFKQLFESVIGILLFPDPYPAKLWFS